MRYYSDRTPTVAQNMLFFPPRIDVVQIDLDRHWPTVQNQHEDRDNDYFSLNGGECSIKQGEFA